MARGRFISKAISLDEKVNALSNDTVRLLFTWLITHLDCEGRMYGNPQTVKSIVFPQRSMKAQTMEKYLKELESFGLIVRYSAPETVKNSSANKSSGAFRCQPGAQNIYLFCPHFEKHQPGLRKDKESASQIPPFTPDLGRSKDGNGLTQVKDKVKDKEEDQEEVKEEGSLSSLNKDNAIESYTDAFGEPSEDMEKEIETACMLFSPSWVIDAIRETAAHGKSSWAYTAGILKNWRKYGKDAEVINVRQPDPEKYTKGKYGKSVQR